jgi:hypothetical protein
MRSPHPAPASWNETYTFPGAKFVRLHFSGPNLVPGGKLVVSSPDGIRAWEYTGCGVTGNGDSGRSRSKYLQSSNIADQPACYNFIKKI